MPGPEAALGRGVPVRTHPREDIHRRMERTVEGWKPESRRIAFALLDGLHALNASPVTAYDSEGNVVVGFSLFGVGLPRRGGLSVEITPHNFSINGAEFPFKKLLGKPDEDIVDVLAVSVDAAVKIAEILDTEGTADVRARLRTRRDYPVTADADREE